MYRLNQKPKKRLPAKIIVVTTVLLLVAVGSATLLVRRHRNNTQQSTQATQSPESLKADKQAGDEIKPSLETNSSESKSDNTTPPTPSSANGKKTVTPIIVSASKDRISSQVEKVVEDGGICKLTLTNGSSSESKWTTTGFANAQNTICPAFDISSGNYVGWKAVVTYTSSTSQGTSASSIINAP